MYGKGPRDLPGEEYCGSGGGWGLSLLLWLLEDMYLKLSTLPLEYTGRFVQYGIQTKGMLANMAEYEQIKGLAKETYSETGVTCTPSVHTLDSPSAS